MTRLVFVPQPWLHSFVKQQEGRPLGHVHEQAYWAQQSDQILPAD